MEDNLLLNDDDSGEELNDDNTVDGEPENELEDNLLIVEERAAKEEEEFSEPKGLNEEGSDPGIVDEETIYANMIEKGAGAHIDEEDMGMHVETLTDKITEDDENLDE